VINRSFFGPLCRCVLVNPAEMRKQHGIDVMLSGMLRFVANNVLVSLDAAPPKERERRLYQVLFPLFRRRFFFFQQRGCGDENAYG